MAWDDEESIFTPGVIVRLQYASYLFLGLFFSMICRGSLGTLFDHFPLLRKGCELAPGEYRDFCAGEMMVYRVSFALALFFFFHWLTVSDLTCCMRSSARAELQTRFFWLKSIILALLGVFTLFLPNAFFAVYAYICLFASAIFLLMNVVLLVDFSYQWSDDWGERMDENNKWMWYLLIVAVGAFVIGVVATILSFYMYVPHTDCNFNAFAVTSVVVGALLYTVLSIVVPHGSIVPSGIVFCYTSCIMFVTLRTTNDDYCNRLGQYTGDPGSIKQMLLAATVASFTLGYSVVSSGGSGSSLNVGQDEEGDDEDPDRSGHLSHYMYFYFVMMMGSMYLAMLATGWHVSGAGEDNFLGSIQLAFWVRSVTVWLAMLLYIWSLLAPYTCCKHRDYGFSTDLDWW